MNTTNTRDGSACGNVVHEEIRRHLGGVDPATLPQITTEFETFQAVNLQAALDAHAADEGVTVRLLGAGVPPSQHMIMFGVSNPELTTVMTSDGVELAGVSHQSLPCGPGEEMVVVTCGLFLFDGPDGPVAAWVREEGFRPHAKPAMDVIAPTVEQAARFHATTRRRMHEHNRFRGEWVQFRGDGFGNIETTFLPRPAVERDQVVLPEGVLDAIEAHAIRIHTARDRMLASGRHLKRGLLLYGPPGTGKTHTVRYLASQLPDATLFVLAGSGMGAINLVKDLVADVTPAIVVLDDVDLIAEDRSLPGMAPRQLLFSLLDAMDGTGEDQDVLFVCTSNRADTIEAAIAARPGRIDHAVEVGRPAAPERRRLLELYARGMAFEVDDLDGLVDATEGVTASFIKELLRRAWLVSRADGANMVVDHHVARALDVLLDPDHPLTPDLLGVAQEAVLQRQQVRGSGRGWCGI